ncbi:MAG: RNA-binding S4 domain-containing protein [Gemmatimonadaceae bacterium]|nr:RNA-binding S4 domain-containing protein [Gemmatimonadaceae bacterium]
MEQVRLDKWLWAARFFKTRALAADAIDIGRVEVNGERVKRAKHVKVADTITVRRPPFAHVIVVDGLSEQRGPASAAQQLYTETADSVAARERLAGQLRAAGTASPADAGRPTRQDRRAIDRWRGRDS